MATGPARGAAADLTDISVTAVDVAVTTLQTGRLPLKTHITGSVRLTPTAERIGSAASVASEYYE